MIKHNNYIFEFKKTTNNNSKWYNYQTENEEILESVYYLIFKNKKSNQYFSDDKILASKLGIERNQYRKILYKYGARRYRCNKDNWICKKNKWVYSPSNKKIDNRSNQLYFKNQEKIEKAIEYLEAYLIMEKLMS